MRLLKGDKPHFPVGKHGSGNKKSLCLIEQMNCLGPQSTFPQNSQGNFQYFLATPRRLLCQNQKAHFMHQLHLAVESKQPQKGTYGLRDLIVGFHGFLYLQVCILLSDHFGTAWDWTNLTDRMFPLISVIRQILTTYRGKGTGFYSIIVYINNCNVQDVPLFPLQLTNAHFIFLKSGCIIYNCVISLTSQVYKQFHT